MLDRFLHDARALGVVTVTTVTTVVSSRFGVETSGERISIDNLVQRADFKVGDMSAPDPNAAHECQSAAQQRSLPGPGAKFRCERSMVGLPIADQMIR